MTCEKLFAAVLISIIFTDLKSQVRNPTRTYRRPWDIAKFVSRGQPIWTYKTTEHTDKSCKVDIVRHASEVFVTFNRSYDYHGQRPNIQMLGRFDLTNRAEIRIGRVGMLPNCVEKMVYMSPDSSCALILVSSLDMRRHYFDLRVKNSSVEAGPHAYCRREFCRLRKRGTVLYEPACQRRLRPYN
ncbi:uncharacterized protein [Dermacentor albipictus]|uniref:uncharacterized protein isoform X2 n=1 Tax=Dermacentor albipictus TaxID=60249 RepID=UPI0038FD0420